MCFKELFLFLTHRSSTYKNQSINQSWWRLCASKNCSCSSTSDPKPTRINQSIYLGEGYVLQRTVPVPQPQILNIQESINQSILMKVMCFKELFMFLNHRSSTYIEPNNLSWWRLCASKNFSCSSTTDPQPTRTNQSILMAVMCFKELFLFLNHRSSTYKNQSINQSWWRLCASKNGSCSSTTDPQPTRINQSIYLDGGYVLLRTVPVPHPYILNLQEPINQSWWRLCASKNCSCSSPIYPQPTRTNQSILMKVMCFKERFLFLTHISSTYKNQSINLDEGYVLQRSVPVQPQFLNLQEPINQSWWRLCASKKSSCSSTIDLHPTKNQTINQSWWAWCASRQQEHLLSAIEMS